MSEGFEDWESKEKARLDVLDPDYWPLRNSVLEGLHPEDKLKILGREAKRKKYFSYKGLLGFGTLFRIERLTKAVMDLNGVVGNDRRDYINFGRALAHHIKRLDPRNIERSTKQEVIDQITLGFDRALELVFEAEMMKFETLGRDRELLYEVIHAVRPRGRLERNYQIVNKVKGLLKRLEIPLDARRTYLSFTRDVIEAHDRFGIQDPRREVPDQVIKEYDRALELGIEAEKITYVVMGANQEVLSKIAETVRKEILVKKRREEKAKKRG